MGYNTQVTVKACWSLVNKKLLKELFKDKIKLEQGVKLLHLYPV